MSNVLRDCPNCGAKALNHPENGCILATLWRVIAERESASEEDGVLPTDPAEWLAERIATTDTDTLWDALGPVIDRLQDGQFSED